MTTFVLIHGSYQGGWIWQRVASRLRASGHTVYAPSLDGCAERKHQVRAGITTETHAAEIAEMLFYEDLKDVVMVGGYQQVEFDFVADNPGPTLFHCHQQLHMDFGFMALFRYA